jgi:hypothetical protein
VSQGGADLNLMDPTELAAKLKRLNIHTDPWSRVHGLKQHCLNAAPFGSAYVTISLAEQGPVASSNFNRLYLYGTEEGLTAEGLRRIGDLFRQAGVAKYYVWLSPGPRIEIVRSWLTEGGLTRIPYVHYPTLARDARTRVHAAARIEAREMETSEAKRLVERHEGIAWPDYVRSAGAPGFHHFMAFDNGLPIATAVLCVLDDLGYLGTALTGEPFRGRGAQQALIAKRIETAVRTGLPCRCFRDTIVSASLPGQSAKGRIQNDLRKRGVRGQAHENSAALAFVWGYPGV